MEDFTYYEINWEEKYKSIIKMCAKMNIAVKDTLFIDDNIAEIKKAQIMLQNIKLGLAKSAEYTLNYLEYYSGIIKLKLNKEDKTRNLDIKSNEIRSNLLSNMDEEEYFKELQIKLDYFINPKDKIRRIVDLLNKTNQFIFSYKRYNEQNILTLLNDKNLLIVAVAMEDKLFDSGIIAIVIFKQFNNLIILDELVISCRALGRNIENTIIFQAFLIAKEYFSNNKIQLIFKEGERNLPAIKWINSNILLKHSIKLQIKDKYSIINYSILEKVNNKNISINIIK